MLDCQMSFVCDHKLYLSAIISGTSMGVMWWLHERSMWRTISHSGWLMENNAIKKQWKKRSRVFIYKSTISANFFLRYCYCIIYFRSFLDCEYYWIILFSYMSKCRWRALDSKHKTSWGVCYFRKKLGNLPKCQKLSCWRQLRSLWDHQRCSSTTVSWRTFAAKSASWR